MTNQESQPQQKEDGSAAALRAALNRVLLRAAGEHLGTLAEEARLAHERFAGRRGAAWTAKQFYNRYARLSKLSTDVLEIANG